jgi:hypothetical protein
MRFGTLSMRMGLVAVLKGKLREYGGVKKKSVMARVIEFYIPKHFQKTSKRGLQLQSGKVIEFCAKAKKLA